MIQLNNAESFQKRGIPWEVSQNIIDDTNGIQTFMDLNAACV